MQKIMYNQQYGLETAVINGLKDMTRRIAYEGEVANPNWGIYTDSYYACRAYLYDGERLIAKSKYHLGEVVAIAQSYETVLENMIKSKGGYGEEENEFYGIHKDTPGWTNKMFVKAELMPVKQKCTDIKVERLQDISDEDCLREGIIKREDCINSKMEDIVRYTFENSFENGIYKTFGSPRQAFAALIDKVSGKGTWERNPWVFAYTFELVK